MTNNCTCILTKWMVLLALAGIGYAQTPPAAPAPADQQTPAPAPAPSPPTWSVGPIDFSGLVDIYYLQNFNRPASDFNQLYNFDFKANQFSLNMAKLTLSHDPDPVGFKVDFGFGKAFDWIHSAETSDVFRHLENAYVSVKSKKGYEADFGAFVTSAGAEVIETKDNWNYSRSLLFAWAIPYYHFGLRTVIPVGSHFTGGIQVVNGWNNIEDNNSGKTLGFNGTFTSKKVTWSNVYYVGPENSRPDTGVRNLYDTNLLLTPSDKVNFYINYDYAKNNSKANGSTHWAGIAGAAHFQLNSWFALTPRIEWFNDANGFSTGTKQKVKEFTITAEGKMVEGLLARLEYRRDWSDQKFFDKGSPAASKSMDTIALGVVAFFGPKR